MKRLTFWVLTIGFGFLTLGWYAILAFLFAFAFFALLDWWKPGIFDE